MFLEMTGAGSSIEPVEKSALVRFTPNASRMRYAYKIKPGKKSAYESASDSIKSGYRRAKGRTEDAYRSAKNTAGPRLEQLSNRAVNSGAHVGVPLLAGGGAIGYGVGSKKVEKIDHKAEQRKHEKKAKGYSLGALGGIGVSMASGPYVNRQVRRAYEASEKIREFGPQGVRQSAKIASAANRRLLGSGVALAGIGGGIASGVMSDKHGNLADKHRRAAIAQRRAQLKKRDERKTALQGGGVAGAGAAGLVGGRRLAASGAKQAYNSLYSDSQGRKVGWPVGEKANAKYIRGMQKLNAGKAMARAGAAGIAVGGGMAAASGVSAVRRKRS